MSTEAQTNYTNEELDQIAEEIAKDHAAGDKPKRKCNKKLKEQKEKEVVAATSSNENDREMETETEAEPAKKKIRSVKSNKFYNVTDGCYIHVEDLVKLRSIGTSQVDDTHLNMTLQFSSGHSPITTQVEKTQIETVASRIFSQIKSLEKRNEKMAQSDKRKRDDGESEEY